MNPGKRTNHLNTAKKKSKSLPPRGPGGQFIAKTDLHSHTPLSRSSDEDDLSSTASSLSLTNTDDFFGSADSRHWTLPTSEPPQIQPPQSTVHAISCLRQMSSKDSEFWFEGTDGKTSPGEFIRRFMREMKGGTEQERLDNFEYYLKEGSEADEWFRVLDAGKKKK